MTKTKKILASIIAFAIVLTILPASLLVSAAVSSSGPWNDAEMLEMFGYNQGLVTTVKAAITVTDNDDAKTTADELASVKDLSYNGTSGSGNTPLFAIPTLGFSKLTRLEKLTLTNHTFSNLSGLPVLNAIPNAAPNGYTGLKELTLNNNPYLSDLNSLYNARNITTLIVNNCALTNLNGVNYLTYLQRLVANNNKITSASPLSSCTSLLTADLQNNQINSLSGVTSIQTLGTIDLSNNKITTISGYNLVGRSLTTLNLKNNQIKTISSDSYNYLATLVAGTTETAGLLLDGNNLSANELQRTGFVANTNMVGTQTVVNAYGIPTEISQTINFNHGGANVKLATVAVSDNKFVETSSVQYSLFSSDPLVADVTPVVANGVTQYYTIAPRKVGTFDIMATYASSKTTIVSTARVSSGITGSIVINDKENPNISVNSQKLLLATITPFTGVPTPGAIEWTSSNPAILTVYPNSANPLSATVVSYGQTGSATITAKMTDGSNKSDSINISVVNPVTSISFNSPKNSMVTDETQNLSVAYNPSNATYKNVTYTSSNTAIATINGSVVTAKTPGITTITATTTGNDYPRSTYFTLTVTAGDLAIKLDKKNTKIYIDQDVKVTAKVTPTYLADGKVTWKSDDSSIASVDDGVITGRKIGKTTISAKYSKNGDTVGAYIDIEVVNPNVKVTLDDYSVNLNPEETYDIDYSVTPTDLPNRSVTFSTSNEDVAAVTSEGMIIAGKAGKATITVKSKYNSKYVARLTVTVKPKTPSLSVKKSGSTANLTAGTSAGATRYRYYYKIKSSDSYKRISDTTSKTFKLTNLKSNQIYYFAVRSYVTVDGKNIYSGYKKVTLNPVVATPKFTYSKTNSSVTLKVTNPPKGSKYVYYMKNEPEDSFERLSGGTTKTSYKATGLQRGEYYYFTVRQYNTIDGKNVYSKYKTIKVTV